MPKARLPAPTNGTVIAAVLALFSGGTKIGTVPGPPDGERPTYRRVNDGGGVGVGRDTVVADELQPAIANAAMVKITLRMDVPILSSLQQHRPALQVERLPVREEA